MQRLQGAAQIIHARNPHTFYSFFRDISLCDNRVIEAALGEAEAAALREDAEVAAGKEEYVEAIELLEESTKELIRAIRSAGVYIPG